MTTRWFHIAAAAAGIALGWTCAAPAVAQVGGLAEMNTTMQMSDTLNAQPTTGPGYYVLERAQQVTGAAPPGALPPGALPQGAGGAVSIVLPGATPTPVLPIPRGPQITVLTGTRVFDAISGILLDDAVEKSVPEADRDRYFDDGTHGDLEAGDGKYTRVDVRNDVIGLSNQRVKERLVKALVSADTFDPLKFYGFTLMTTEQRERSVRRQQWRMIPDPNGGLGLRMAQVPVEEPVTVPSYRTWEAEKDRKVRDDWANRFLQEFRINKDDLQSEFYKLYIPMPPQPPSVIPPVNWTPFNDPGSLVRYQQQQQQQIQQTFQQLNQQQRGARGGFGGAGGGFGGAPPRGGF